MQLQTFRPNGQSNDVMEFNSAQVAAAVTGVQARVFMAKQFPRDEKRAIEVLKGYCEDFNFAIDALYAFPRGETTVMGLSVVFARAAVQQWGNMTSGWEQTGETSDAVLVQGFCWDLQTNATKTYLLSVGKKVMKKVYEKGKYIRTDWVPADERQLRELIARTGSMMERNAVVNSFPAHVTQACLERAKVTVAANSSTPQAIERTINAFKSINVSEQQLEQYAGKQLKKLHSSSPVWTELPVMYRRIKANEMTWNDVMKARYDSMTDYDDNEPEPTTTTQPQQTPNNAPQSAQNQSEPTSAPVTPTPTAPTQQSENLPQTEQPQSATVETQTETVADSGKTGLRQSDFTTDEWTNLSRWLWVGHGVQMAQTAKWVAASSYESKEQLLADAKGAFDAKQTKKGR